MCLCAFISVSYADVVELHDGRQFEGRIVSESPRSVRIDCVVAGIRAIVEFNRADIRDVTYRELPGDFFDRALEEDSAGEAANEDASFDRRPWMRVSTVPLHDTIGEEVKADVVREVLMRLRQVTPAGADHLVLVDINSHSGFISEAWDIVHVLDEFRDQFEFVGVVRRALDVSLLVALACDRLLFMPDGILGGGVAAAASDPLLVEKIGAMAAGRGHNGDIVRAMIVRQATLHQWRDDNGRIRIGADDAQGAPERERVVGPDAALTVSSGQARLWGLADVLNPAQGEAAIAEMIHPEKRWRSASRYGEVAQDAAAKRWREWRADHDGRELLYQTIQNRISEARAADPERQRYSTTSETYRDHRGRFHHRRVPTREAWQKWYSATDSAVAAWRAAERDLRRLIANEALAEHYHRTRRYSEHELQSELQRCVREIDRLRGIRSRGPGG